MTPLITTSLEFRTVLAQLRAHSAEHGDDTFPFAQWNALQAGGILRWGNPESSGGVEISGAEMTEGYRLMASECLLTTFVLTQRNGACQRIASSDNEAAKQNLLSSVVSGKTFATVGISHLTTSGQHLSTPPVQATHDGAGFRLTGRIPWATAATKADLLITGGTLSDGTQLLAAVPTNRDGVTVEAPVPLLALNGSETGAVTLDDVAVSPDEILHGPIERVMFQGAGGGTGSLTTSALAVGASASSIARFAEEADRRPELNEFLSPLQQELDTITADLSAAAANPASTDPAHSSESLRRRANSLALRSSQAYLASTKGAGFVQGHPAERAVRQATFFLVWSCPQPVISANLRELACGTH